MIKHEIKKNFLDKELFNAFKKEMFSNRCGWYWQPHQVEKDRGYFGHYFYAEHRPNSDFYTSFIVPIVFMLGVKMLENVRANCLLKDTKKHFTDYHTDRPYDCTTSILYMNTNNGYTLLGEKEKIKIKSEENKMVTFNSQVRHCGVSQTDTDRRIVINFNYYI